MIAGRVTKPSFVLAPGGKRSFETAIPAPGMLEYSLVVRNDLSPEFTGSVTVQVTISDIDGKELKQQVSVYPGHSETMPWNEYRLDLNGLKPGKITIVYSVKTLKRGLTRTDAELWAIVGSPVIIPRKPDPHRKHVVFFLMDTLRSDHLGCYGYPEQI